MYHELWNHVWMLMYHEIMCGCWCIMKSCVDADVSWNHVWMLMYHEIMCVSLDAEISVPGPHREAEQFWSLPPVWNFSAVSIIWFHFSICSLIILPGPVAPLPWYDFCGWLGFKNQLSIYPVTRSVFSFFCFWPIILPTFQEIILNFFLEMGLFVWPLF